MVCVCVCVSISFSLSLSHTRTHARAVLFNVVKHLDDLHIRIAQSLRCAAFDNKTWVAGVSMLLRVQKDPKCLNLTYPCFEKDYHVQLL